MSKLIIEIEGGLVQALYSDDKDLEIAIVDWDTEGEIDEDGNDESPLRGIHKADYILKNLHTKFKSDKDVYERIKRWINPESNRKITKI